MKLALFGGSFDPIHNAHLLIAAHACETLELDRVLFVPCRKSPHKTGIRTAPGEDRLALARAATRNLPWAEVSDIELKREGLSYSVDTVEAISREHPEARLYWLMGSDQWEVLEEWRDHERLARMVRFIVYPRPEPPTEKPGIAADFIEFRYDLSASTIRQRIQEGRDVSMMLPAPVVERIRLRGLYKEKAES